MALLLADLGVTKTHSRPHVSNDNPFSESAFKTLKYRPGFPERFVHIEHARAHGGPFFDWYNNEHHHGSLGLCTPHDVHYGLAAQTLQRRANVLDAAFVAHPERFMRGRPVPTIAARRGLDQQARVGGRDQSGCSVNSRIGCLKLVDRLRTPLVGGPGTNLPPTWLAGASEEVAGGLRGHRARWPKPARGLNESRRSDRTGRAKNHRCRWRRRQRRHEPPLVEMWSPPRRHGIGIVVLDERKTGGPCRAHGTDCAPLRRVGRMLTVMAFVAIDGRPSLDQFWCDSACSFCERFGRLVRVDQSRNHVRPERGHQRVTDDLLVQHAPILLSIRPSSGSLGLEIDPPCTTSEKMLRNEADPKSSISRDKP